MRLFIIYSVIMYMIKRDSRYLLLPGVIGILTYFIWKRQSDTTNHEITKQSINDQLGDLVQLNDLETECSVPTKENPFMNPSFNDYGNGKEKPRSCPSYNNIGMQRRMDELFNEDVYETSMIFLTPIMGSVNFTPYLVRKFQMIKAPMRSGCMEPPARVKKAPIRSLAYRGVGWVVVVVEPEQPNNIYRIINSFNFLFLYYRII